MKVLYYRNGLHREPDMTPEQCRMARAGLSWGVRDLASRAGLAFTTVSRFENGSGTHSSTVEKIKSTLERAGVKFLDDEGRGVGVRVNPDGGADQ